MKNMMIAIVYVVGLILTGLVIGMLHAPVYVAVPLSIFAGVFIGGLAAKVASH